MSQQKVWVKHRQSLEISGFFAIPERPDISFNVTNLTTNILYQKMESLLDLLLSTWPFWVLVLMAGALLILLRMFGGESRLPYRARGRLVTKSELKFYKSLQKAVQDDWQIFAMVRIAELLRVEEGIPNRRKWINKILAKHIDFVLCHPNTLEPIVCIELDDKSHQRKDRIERDIFVNHAFESAELPLLRVPVQNSYRAREIRGLIDDVL